MRYFGGNTNADIANLVNADGTPGSAISLFMTHIPNPLDRVYTLNSIPAPIPNPNAVFASFVGESMLNGIKAIANGNLPYGFRDMRDFVYKNFPNLAYVLGHMGEITFYNIAESNDFANTDINGDVQNIEYKFGIIISEIFDTTRPFVELYNLSELGVANDSERQSALMEDIKKLYNLNNYIELKWCND
jgi:hypothetical protein